MRHWRWLLLAMSSCCGLAVANLRCRLFYRWLFLLTKMSGSLLDLPLQVVHNYAWHVKKGKGR